MHQGPKERKDRKVCSLEPLLLGATKHLAVDTDLGKQDVQPRHRICENGCPPVTDPQRGVSG